MGGPSSDQFFGLVAEQVSIIAKACLAGDLTPRGMAHFAEVDLDEALACRKAALGAGIIGPDGTITDMVRAHLVGDLSSATRSRVHTMAAQRLLTDGPGRLPDTLHHLREAATLAGSETAVQLADNAGRLSLSLGDYLSASALLALAAEFDISNDFLRQGHRLCDLAAAVDSLGDLHQARRHTARAVALGELAGDGALVARAAVAHTLPVDWHAGDQRTHGLLERANRMALHHHDQVSVTAARALAEMRIPVMAGEHQQVAWVTRPSVAQPLAEEALREAQDCPPEVQCLAALAWRSTHRAPPLLQRRLAISAQARDLAQSIRNPAFQVEAAVWLAVDTLESGDRESFEEALSAAQWVAHHDKSPRLQFRALTVAMGAALRDGDHDRARELMDQTTAIVSRLDASLLLIVRNLFLAQLAISEDDPDHLAALGPEPSSGLLAHPLGRSVAAYIWARTGQPELAVEQIRRALVQRDAESSLLLVGTRSAAVALATGDEPLCREVLDILSPYASHVSVDANGWWCDGPVSVWLAMLQERLGDVQRATQLLADGEPVARSLNDVRSLQRCAHLRQLLDTCVHAHAVTLTSREIEVLRRLATGATNEAIARDLEYSLSTVRNDTIVLYRKLNVSGRPDAVAKAVALGLLEPDSEP